MTELGQNLIDALALGSLYALIALGITLVYTVMGMMNFAHGEFIMLSAYALFVFAGMPFAAAVVPQGSGCSSRACRPAIRAAAPQSE